MNGDIEEYNAVLARLAEEYRAELLDLYDGFEKQGAAKFLGEDGIHPNALGYTVIFDIVKEYIFRQLV